MAELSNPPEEKILDPDFSQKEHEEFEKIEAENPYQEIKEEIIRIPQRPEHITDTRNDIRFLIIFCVVIAIILGIIICLSLTGFGPI